MKLIRQLLASSRYLVIMGVVCSLISSITTLIFGSIELIKLMIDILTEGILNPKIVKPAVFGFIQVADLFLLATAFYIISLGLYELFIDNNIRLPDWLEISDLDDLKSRLVKIIIVLMGIQFLGYIINWDGEKDILSIGISISLVIAALTFFLNHKTSSKH